jgi:hypothetical protein
MKMKVETEVIFVKTTKLPKMASKTRETRGNAWNIFFQKDLRKKPTLSVP